MVIIGKNEQTIDSWNGFNLKINMTTFTISFY